MATMTGASQVDPAVVVSDGLAAGGEPAAGVLPLERLEARICSRSADVTAAEGLWLLDVAEFDRREGWARWGVVSCAAWLCWQVGLEMRAAREKVRVANALSEFPVIATAMCAGRLSYSKARAITRIANEHNAVELVDIALAATSNQVERYVAGYLRATADADERSAFERRSLALDQRDGMTEIRVRVPAEAGRAVSAAIDAFVVPDRELSLEQRRADALVELAECAFAHHDDRPRPRGPRYLATVHLGPDAFATRAPGDGAAGDDAAGNDPASPADPASPTDAASPATPADTADADPARNAQHAERAGRVTGGDAASEWRRMCRVAAGTDGPAHASGVPAETARRLLCDAAIEGIAYDGTGNPLDVGRQTRTISDRLRRALYDRDGGCRFPGCTHRGWLDGHHITHWTDHGITAPENLLLLCRTHHRVVHEGRWRIDGNPGGDVVFVHPDGRRVPAAPPPVDGDAAMVDALGHTDEDGRCQWAGDKLDLGYAISTMLANEAIHRRRAQAHCS